MSTVIHRLIAEIRKGALPNAICRMRSGWVILGDRQVRRGYCLLLADPVVADINALPDESRRTFLSDMALLGDALLDVTGAARINYEILGNSEPALHAHVIPRYDDEPEDLRTKPVWLFNWDAAPTFDAERDATLINEIAEGLSELGGRMEG
jgi:diadenosine tetraphosphate (Ap4A) HIT family hydrolase